MYLDEPVGQNNSSSVLKIGNKKQKKYSSISTFISLSIIFLVGYDSWKEGRYSNYNGLRIPTYIIYFQYILLAISAILIVLDRFLVYLYEVFNSMHYSKNIILVFHTTYPISPKRNMMINKV